MGKKSRLSRYQTAFGEALADQLHKRRKTQAYLAKDAGVSLPYVNQMMTGRKPVSAHWADLVSTTLKLQADDRAKLHRAAVKDQGYKIDP